MQAIGGIQEKIAAAQKAGATAFFVPANNCRDLEGVRTTMTLIKVATSTRPSRLSRLSTVMATAPCFHTADEPFCQPGRPGISELAAEQAHTLT